MILVVGNYGNKVNGYNGQSVRTNTVYQSICSDQASEKVMKVDTADRNLLNKVKLLILSLVASKIVLMPGVAGIQKTLRLYKNCNCLRKTTIVVIGGWLADYLRENKGLVKELNKTKGNLVQTKQLKKELEALGVENAIYFPNYRRTTIQPSVKAPKQIEKLVFYSRVCKEKGTQDAIEAVLKFNREYNTSINLDVYGPIQPDFEDEFKAYLKYPTIHYKGVVEPTDSFTVLPNYDLMLFPTSYDGEGFPGVILESFCCGVPVLATNWKFNAEVIEQDQTGYLFEVGDVDGLCGYLKKIYDFPDLVERLSENCIKEGSKFEEEKVFSILRDQLMKKP